MSRTLQEQWRADGEESGRGLKMTDAERYDIDASDFSHSIVLQASPRKTRYFMCGLLRISLAWTHYSCRSLIEVAERATDGEVANSLLLKGRSTIRGKS
jgi:hypothetical protein